MEDTSPPFIIARTIFIILDVVCTVLGNAVSIVVIHRTRGFSDSIQILMISLCIADLGVGLTLAPSIVSSGLDKWIFGDPWCKITSGLLAVCLSMSVFSLLGVSVDRLIAICWPLRHPALVTKRKVQGICIALWAISVVFATVNVLTNAKYDVYVPIASLCYLDYKPDDIAQETFFTSVLCVMPLGTIITIYTVLLNISSGHQRRLRNVNLPSTNLRVAGALSDRVVGQVATRRTVNINRKALKMFLVVTLGFALCWVPHFAVRLYGTVTGGDVPQWLRFVYLWLPMSNSFWNVIIYTLMNGSFRREMLKLLRARCWPEQRVTPQYR